MENMNPTSSTLYPELNAVLRELASGVRRVLDDNFVAAFLQGSFAVGDFDEHSDVDFVIVTDGDIPDARLRNLRSMHECIFDLDSEWARRLEGSYFPAAVLRDYTQTGRKLWYLDNGSRVLVRSSHCNKVVVRWILREKGIVLAGPQPSTLIDPIPVPVLRRAILTSINESGREILAHPERYNNRFYQSFIVLHYCRKLHDLRAGTVGSKRSGAEWVKRNLDQSWASLIDRAWSGRPNPACSIRQPADNADFERTLQFVRQVMDAASAFAEAEGILF